MCTIIQNIDRKHSETRSTYQKIISSGRSEPAPSGWAERFKTVQLMNMSINKCQYYCIVNQMTFFI